MDGEGVYGVEDGVAIEEIDGAMEIRSSGLGCDFKTRASRIREKYGVRVLVDADVLDRRGSDPRAVGFDTVYDQRDAVGRGGVVIKKAGERGDVVLVEDRDTIKSVPVKGVCALVFRAFGAHLRSGIGGAYGDGFGLRSECEGDAHRNGTL